MLPCLLVSCFVLFGCCPWRILLFSEEKVEDGGSGGDGSLEEAKEAKEEKCWFNVLYAKQIYFHYKVNIKLKKLILIFSHFFLFLR